MRNSTKLGVLVAVFALSAVGTLVLSGLNFIAQKQLEQVRARDFAIKTTLNNAQRLANESGQYSLKKPAITAVLTNFQSKARRAPMPQSAPDHTPPPDTNQPPAETPDTPTQ